MKLIGYKPRAWQKAVHTLMQNDVPNGVYVVKAKRQLGKSLMCCNVLLYYALNKQKSVNAIVSPTLGQARKIFKDIVNAAPDVCIKKKNETLLEIEFVNGSIIYFKSGQQKDSLRGYTITGVLILDEAAYLDDDILQLVLPWTTVHKAPMLVVSTPKTKSGFFYNYYLDGLNPEIKDTFSVDWNDYDTSEFLPPERVEQLKKLMPKGQFTTEILGEFVDDGTGVFRTSMETWIGMIDYNSYNQIYVGIDFSNSDEGDYCCVSGFNERGEQVVLQYQNTKGPLQSVMWIKDLLIPLKGKVQCVLCERNSMGATQIDLLRKYMPGWNIVSFDTTNTSKRDVVELLAAGIGEGKAKLYGDPEMRKEVSCFAMELTPSGLITYNGHNAHDDLVMATCFAWKAKTSFTGTYCVSVV